ncbi:unnamed protein product, partial [Staurois parvus]
MRGPGRPDIVNAGSGESGYSECGVLETITIVIQRVDWMAEESLGLVSPGAVTCGV